MLVLVQKLDIISIRGSSDILPLNSDNQLKIIRTAKHLGYSDSWLISESCFSNNRDPEKRKQTEPFITVHAAVRIAQKLFFFCS